MYFKSAKNARTPTEARHHKKARVFTSSLGWWVGHNKRAPWGWLPHERLPFNLGALAVIEARRGRAYRQRPDRRLKHENACIEHYRYTALPERRRIRLR